MVLRHIFPPDLIVLFKRARADHGLEMHDEVNRMDFHRRLIAKCDTYDQMRTPPPEGLPRQINSF